MTDDETYHGDELRELVRDDYEYKWVSCPECGTEYNLFRVIDGINCECETVLQLYLDTSGDS